MGKLNETKLSVGQNEPKISRRALVGGGLALLAAAAIRPGWAAEPAPQTLRVAFVRATVCAPSMLLQRFMPEGWKAELTPFSSPTDMSNALLTDGMDVAYTGLTVAIVARSRDQGVNIVANGAGKGTGIVAASKSDIRSIADLKGKRVANLPLSIHDILLREELKKVGLQLGDLNTIRLTVADMPAALQRGDIDAFVGGEPAVSTAQLGGYGRLLLYPYDNPVGVINVGVLSSDTAVTKRAALMKVWGEAHAKATEYLAANPDALADLVSKEWGYDRAAARKSLENIQLSWGMDTKFKSELKAYTERLKELGAIARLPDFDKLVVSQFVDGVKT